MGGRLASAVCAGWCGLLLAACGSQPAVTLEPVQFNQWERELVSLRGKLVVVDVWATWCLPCLERFPHIVELNRRYRDRGVTVVSMSVDDRDDKKAAQMARQFLVKQNARFRNYLMDEPILDAFEKLGVQGIPAVFIYDRTGRRRYFLNADDPNHQFTSKEVDDAIAKLLSEPGPRV
jgi:thiol-disulfide isomerase/thioredoxin